MTAITAGPQLCAGCGFNNLPKATTCLRCRQALDERVEPGAVEEITPPRAARWRKRLPWRGALPAVDRWLSGAALRRRARRFESLMPERVGRLDGPTVLRAAVPGWPLMRDQRPREAQRLVLAYVGCVALAAFTFGTQFAFLPLSGAISLHVFSALWAWRTELALMGWFPRMARSLAVWFLLFALIYYPVGQVTQAAFPVLRFQQDVPGVFEDGDVVALERVSWPPPRGAIVAANLPAGNFVVAGIVVDRVLAYEGDVVRWSARDERLTVNGEAVPRERWPLRPGRMPAEFTVRVPEAKVMILPSSTGTRFMRDMNMQGAGGRISFHAEANIIGRPTRVLWPWGSRGVVRPKEAR